MRYQKKTEMVTAFQWQGHCEATQGSVHPFPVPGIDEVTGWIGSTTWGQMVHVGDWIVTDAHGCRSVVTDEEFKVAYDPVPEAPSELARGWHRVAKLMGQRVKTPDGVGTLIGAETPAHTMVSWELALWLVWFGETEGDGGAWNQKRYSTHEIEELSFAGG